jgi:hypothetical protein
MLAHAKLSASGAERWLNCPGSVKAEEGHNDKGSIHALEGTRAHAIAELCFARNCFADAFLGSTVEGGVVDDEMVQHVNGYVDYVRTLCAGSDFLEIEQRLDFGRWVPDGFGTSDVVALKGETLIICDLKYGKGVEVSAEENSQLMLYALGAIAEHEWLSNIKTVLLCIYQPRKNNFSEWETTAENLLQWGEWVKERAVLAMSSDAPRKPGEKQCMWCKAKATCPALYDHTQKIVGGDFDNLDNPDSLPVDKLLIVLGAKKLIEGYLSAVSDYALTLAEQNSLPGYKLVEGRSNRQWKEEAEAEKALAGLVEEDKLYKKSFVSVAQAEKLLGKKNAAVLSELVIKPRGKPALALETDCRKKINDSSDDFENIA